MTFSNVLLPFGTSLDFNVMSGSRTETFRGSCSLNVIYHQRIEESTVFDLTSDKATFVRLPHNDLKPLKKSES